MWLLDPLAFSGTFWSFVNFFWVKEEIGSLLLALCDTYLNHDRLVSRQTTLQEIVFPSRCLIFPQIAECLTRRPILEKSNTVDQSICRLWHPGDRPEQRGLQRRHFSGEENRLARLGKWVSTRGEFIRNQSDAITGTDSVSIYTATSQDGESYLLPIPSWWD